MTIWGKTVPGREENKRRNHTRNIQRDSKEAWVAGMKGTRKRTGGNEDKEMMHGWIE